MPEFEYNIPINTVKDVCIYVLSRVQGEGNDRRLIKGDYYLTDTEKKNILYLNNHAKKFMLVLNIGSPIDLSGLEDVKNVLLLSQLGNDTSKALVDVILGKANPSGKLSETWTTYSNYDLGTFGDLSDTNYNEGIYVGYRYFDIAKKDVLFPFGYGLSYTEFEEKINAINLVNNDLIININVKNIGRMNGKDVVEVYVSKIIKDIDTPYQELIGFSKTRELLPDSSESLDININLNDLSIYDSKNEAYIVKSGKYLIRYGNSSKNTKIGAILRVKEDIIIKKVKNILPKIDLIDYIPKDIDLEYDDIEYKFDLDSSNFNNFIIDYNKQFEVSNDAKMLRDQDAIRLGIGWYNPKGGLKTVIGSQSLKVAGAAGETIDISGLGSLIMADGPSGLRLARDYFTNRKGNHSLNIPIPNSMIEYLPWYAKLFFNLIRPRKRRGVHIKHQYATALPIPTAIAQSFNKELAFMCGDIVGNEMELFGVDLWLAPALNIKRNPLCGRNFEYFSEDPYLSGIMAGNITKGVHKHHSKAVTYKHFLANNQEYNRYLNSSNLNERAFREIYLKSFEYAIREESPDSIMTSYNLINGIHTNEFNELLKDVLRIELEFDGIIMTDWITGNSFLGKENKYSYPNVINTMNAYSNLFMPGSKRNYNEVIKGLEEGLIKREQIDINNTFLINSIKSIKRRGEE